MAKTAHHVAGITVVVGMATEWGIKAKLSAFFSGSNVLIHRIHCLQNTASEFLEFAELHGLVHAVILQIIETLSNLESVRSSDGQSVHV